MVAADSTSAHAIWQVKDYEQENATSGSSAIIGSWSRSVSKKSPAVRAKEINVGCDIEVSMKMMERNRQPTDSAKRYRTLTVDAPMKPMKPLHSPPFPLNIYFRLQHVALRTYLRLRKVYLRLNIKALAFIYGMTTLSYLFAPPMPGGTPEETRWLVWALFASGGFMFAFFFTLYQVGLLDWIFKKKGEIAPALIKPREFGKS